MLTLRSITSVTVIAASVGLMLLSIALIAKPTTARADEARQTLTITSKPDRAGSASAGLFFSVYSGHVEIQSRDFISHSAQACGGVVSIERFKRNVERFVQGSTAVSAGAAVANSFAYEWTANLVSLAIGGALSVPAAAADIRPMACVAFVRSGFALYEAAVNAHCDLIAKRELQTMLEKIHAGEKADLHVEAIHSKLDAKVFCRLAKALAKDH